MQDGIDRANWPSTRGPWHEVRDLTRLYDHGAVWCINSDGHPAHEAGYPDPDKHFPYDECQSPSRFVSDVRADLGGPELDLAIYGALPFRFGQPRGDQGPGRPRVMLDLCELATGAARVRFSIAMGEALLLAQHLRQLAVHLN